MNVFTLNIDDIFNFFNNNFNKNFNLNEFINSSPDFGTIFSFIDYIYHSTYELTHKQLENDITLLTKCTIEFDNLKDGDIIKFSDDLFGSSNDGIFIFDALNLRVIGLDFTFNDEYGVIPSEITYPRFDIDYWKNVILTEYFCLDENYIKFEIERQKLENGGSLKTIHSHIIESEIFDQFNLVGVDVEYIELHQSNGLLMKLFLIPRDGLNLNLHEKIYMIDQYCEFNGVVETCIF
jgi:hypothetical protein